MILDFDDEYKSHFFDVKGTDRNVSNFLTLDEKQVGIDSGEVRTSCWRTSSAGPEVPTAAVPALTPKPRRSQRFSTQSPLCSSTQSRRDCNFKITAMEMDGSFTAGVECSALSIK